MDPRIAFDALIALSGAFLTALIVVAAVWAGGLRSVREAIVARKRRRLELLQLAADSSPVDNPIQSESQDLLGRAEVAHDFARGLRRLDFSQGLVVGILGPWGSGKSSFVNLMKEQFRESPELTVVDFNPWMFSGTEQLVDVFFKELAAELRLKDANSFGQIADDLDDYGDILSPIAMIPVVGGWFDRTQRAYKSARKWWKERSATPLKDEISDALSDLAKPIIVVVDDIDRLSTHEIRDVFKLVRLTASFPNVGYVLAFDRKRVEDALDDDKIPGRAYLEKIVQLSFDLPEIPSEVLRRQVLERLAELAVGIADLRFDQERWSRVYFQVIEPLIGTMRDVSRFVLSARPTMESLASRIDAVDLLALEAIRVFRPEMFAQLPKLRIALTAVSRSFDGQADPTQQAAVDQFISMDERTQVGRPLIAEVFPAARRYLDNYWLDSQASNAWRSARRVAHIDFLNLYLDRTAPTGLIALIRSETAFSLFGQPDELRSYLESLEPGDLEDVITGLEAFEDSFLSDYVTPVVPILLNLIPAIPERARRGITDIMRPDLVVDRVVLRLLRKLPESEIASALPAMLDDIESYSSQSDLLRIVGHQEHAGHRLVPIDVAKSLDETFAKLVLTTRPPKPSQEWDLLRVVWFARSLMPGRKQRWKFDDAEMARALFRSARSQATSQSMDGSNLRVQERLWWDGLISVLGSAADIQRARDLLEAVDGRTPLVELVDRYLSGWTPSDDWSITGD